MKEIEQLGSLQDKVKIVNQQQVEKKKILIKTQTFHPNQRCFEINIKTREIKEADYKHAATFDNGYKKSIDMREGCEYIIAINKKNALKKYNKL